MLFNNVDIISNFNINKDISSVCELDCWIKKEADEGFNIYIFSMQINSTDELDKNWNKFVNNISLYFQSKLEKDIERWNIYTVFFVNEKVNNSLKYLIEQDKFATRKFIYDSERQYMDIFKISHDTKKEKISEILYNKLFNLSIIEAEGICEVSFIEQIKSISALYGSTMGKNIDRIEALKNYFKEILNAQI